MVGLGRWAGSRRWSTFARMGLEVGATLGRVLVGGCTGMHLRWGGRGIAISIFSWAGFGRQMGCLGKAMGIVNWSGFGDIFGRNS